MKRDDAERLSPSGKRQEVNEYLLSLRGRARDCRHAARICHNSSVSLSLDELADRLEAEAVLMAAKADLFARLEALPS